MLRASLISATFIFMLQVIVYQVLEPWLYATGVQWVDYGHFFVHNYSLMARINSYIIAGLIAYGFGMWFCTITMTKRRARGPHYEVLRLEDANKVTAILCGISAVCWFIMFIRGG